jgi:hypothetical protein
MINDRLIVSFREEMDSSGHKTLFDLHLENFTQSHQESKNDYDCRYTNNIFCRCIQNPFQGNTGISEQPQPSSAALPI